MAYDLALCPLSLSFNVNSGTPCIAAALFPGKCLFKTTSNAANISVPVHCNLLALLLLHVIVREAYFEFDLQNPLFLFVWHIELMLRKRSREITLCRKETQNKCSCLIQQIIISTSQERYDNK